MAYVQFEVKMMADISDSYYARNEKWIRPALIAFIFAFGNSLGDILGVASPIVSTASMWLAAIAFIITGVMVMFTDTISAHILKLLAVVALLGAVITLVIRYFT
ncbi:TPA: hypothetical protein JZI12_001953 [Escherichia coli O157]|nr:hypothetical protein [Escherichia coli O157]